MHGQSSPVSHLAKPCSRQRSRMTALGRQDPVFRILICISQLLPPLRSPPCGTVVRSHSDGVLLAGSKSGLANDWRNTSIGTRSLLFRSATLPATAFDSASDTSPSIAGENTQMYCDSPDDMPTPTLTHSPSSTDSSSGDRTFRIL